MAHLTLPLLLLSLLTLTHTAYPAVAVHSTPSTFITSSCSQTHYPSLCVASLSAFSNIIQQSPKQLVQTALSVSISEAASANTYITRLSKSKGLKEIEYEVVKDCFDTMGDSVERLRKSMEELGQMGDQGGEGSLKWHISNAQTWISAALTDDNTCFDESQGDEMNEKLKSGITSRVIKVARITSNALALINHLADKN